MILKEAISKYYGSVYAYVLSELGDDTDYADECCEQVFRLFSVEGGHAPDAEVHRWLIEAARYKVREHFCVDSVKSGSDELMRSEELQKWIKGTID